MHQQHEQQGEHQHARRATAMTPFTDQESCGAHQHSPHHRGLGTGQHQEQAHGTPPGPDAQSKRT